MTMLRAILLDFYGTLVHEDDINIAEITALIHANAETECTIEEVSRFWHDAFFRRSGVANGVDFVSQRELGILALEDTLAAFRVPLDAETIIQPQFAHWIAPPIFDDTIAFLNLVGELGLTTIVVSNVDRVDVEAAIQFHRFSFDDLITSDDARAYKPRPEMFRLALDLVSAEPRDVLHIGDSFGSDVRGAQAAGIPVDWLNRTGRVLPAGLPPNHELRTLDELHEVVLGLAC
ncbi:MAG: HAD family hydrolase [Thermomicrobiales bacterium]